MVGRRATSAVRGRDRRRDSPPPLPVRYGSRVTGRPDARSTARSASRAHDWTGTRGAPRSRAAWAPTGRESRRGRAGARAGRRRFMRRAVVTFSAPPRTRRALRRQRPGRWVTGRRPRTPTRGAARGPGGVRRGRVRDRRRRPAQELGHARRRDRQVGGLVPLPAPRLGREIGAVGLDDKPVERQRPHDLGEPSRARIRHRPRDRDEEAEIQAPVPRPGRPRSSGGSRRLWPRPPSRAELEQVRVRLATVEEHGPTPARAELRDQRRPLDVARREVAIIVESELTDRDHLRRPGELGNPRERRVIRGGGVMRVNPHRRVDVGSAWASATAASDVGTSVPIVKAAAPAARARARTAARSRRTPCRGGARACRPAGSRVTGSGGGRSAGRRRSRRPRSTARASGVKSVFRE